MHSLTVLVIADEPRRSCIKKILSAHHNVTIVGELISTTNFQLVTRLAPDLVIIDSLTMAINPIYALLTLQSMPHTPWVVVLRATNHIQEQMFWGELGVMGDLTLETIDEIEQALRRIILSGPMYVSSTPQQLAVCSPEYLNM